MGGFMIKNVFVLFAFLFSFHCFANDFVPYSDAKFKAELMSGKKLMLQFHAAWCPVCKKQKNSLMEALKTETYKGIVVMVADYDKEEALIRAYKIPQQSTVLLFQNKNEIGREIGVTDSEEIKNLSKRFK